MNPIAQNAPLLINLKGSQKEMGRQYGEIIAEAGGYREVMDFYPTMAQNLLLQGFPRSSRNAIVRGMVKPIIEFGLSQLDRQRIPRFRERTVAALEGSGERKTLARYLQIMDVFQNGVGFASKFGLVKLHGVRPAFGAVPACSSAVVWDSASNTGELLHARNFDFPGVNRWDQAPVIVFCRPDDGIDYGYIAARGAEIPGITAFNAEGLTITFHTRLHRDIGFDGLGVVDLGHDVVSRARTINEAVEIISKYPIASTWGIVISSAKEKQAVIVETTRKSIAVIPAQGPDYLINTNHYYHPQFQDGECNTSPTFAAHSHGRDKRMHQLLDGYIKKGGATLQDMQALLGDMRDAEDPDTERVMGNILGHNTSVTSMVVAADSGYVSMSVGSVPTGWGPYAKIPMEWADTGSREVDLSKLDHVKNRFTKDKEALAGYAHFKEAAALDLFHGSYAQIMNQMHQAEQHLPKEPAIQTMLGVLALEKKNIKDAFMHFETALANETASYRRGQLMLWSSRCAAALGDVGMANERRRELAKLNNPFLAEYQARAQAEYTNPIPATKLAKVVPGFLLIDAEIAA